VASGTQGSGWLLPHLCAVEDAPPRHLSRSGPPVDGQRFVIPSRAPMTPQRKPRWLVLGDGDFAYSARLAAAGQVDVTATTIDAETELVRRYPTTFPAHKQMVEAAARCRCVFEVDARHLDHPTSPQSASVRACAPYDRLVWNNPYAEAEQSRGGGVHRALLARKVHKKLLVDFLQCAPCVLGAGAQLVISINPASKVIGEDFLRKQAVAAGFTYLSDHAFLDKREHQYILRFGDERDFDRRTSHTGYNKRNLRSFVFEWVAPSADCTGAANHSWFCAHKTTASTNWWRKVTTHAKKTLTGGKVEDSKDAAAAGRQSHNTEKLKNAAEVATTHSFPRRAPLVRRRNRPGRWCSTAMILTVGVGVVLGGCVLGLLIYLARDTGGSFFVLLPSLYSWVSW